jgi:hypothetical protein
MKWLAIKANCKFRLFFIVQIFSPLSNILAPMLNVAEIADIIPELRFKSGFNLIPLYAFIVEKTDDGSLIIPNR